MTAMKNGLLLLAGISMVALAACSEDQGTTVETQPPAATEAQPAAPVEQDRTDDALRRLSEGAESMREGAGELARQARERAERALDDAGPMLDRASEIAGEIGTAIDGIARNALRDFQTGVDMLEQRIEEATGGERPVTGDPDAVLAAPDLLETDTRAAAQAGPAGVGPDYVGVWAGDAASCARIDQEPVEMMAVITPTTMRQYESMCVFSETAMTDDAAALSASCVAEGQMEQRDILLEMPDPDTLAIGRPGMEGPARLVRCHLPR